MLTRITLRTQRMAEITRVAVVGAGTMGSQIALQTGYAGRHRVVLVDSGQARLDRARAQNERGELGLKSGRGFYDYSTR
jgi:3-hydroxyacyl-CoA dehydrogenase